MGDVYRALDSTLGREIAIKVLPAMFTTDPDRLVPTPDRIFINRIPGGHNHFPTWSPDSKWIYFVSRVLATRGSASGGDDKQKLLAVVNENQSLRVECTVQPVDHDLLARAICIDRVTAADGHVQHSGTAGGIHSLRKVALEVTRAVEPQDSAEGRWACERS